jgi:hypothetical protein
LNGKINKKKNVLMMNFKDVLGCPELKECFLRNVMWNTRKMVECPKNSNKVNK